MRNSTAKLIRRYASTNGLNHRYVKRMYNQYPVAKRHGAKIEMRSNIPDKNLANAA